jgi:hypothetical protein
VACSCISFGLTVFNDAFNSSDYIASNDNMIREY